VPAGEKRQIGQKIPSEAYEGLENFAHTVAHTSVAAVLTVLGNEAALAVAEGKASVNWDKVARQARELGNSNRGRRPPS
jgi:hypothetical protein